MGLSRGPDLPTCQYHRGFTCGPDGDPDDDIWCTWTAVVWLDSQGRSSNVVPACFECACQVSKDPDLLNVGEADELEEYARELHALDALSAASFCVLVLLMKEWVT